MFPAIPIHLLNHLLSQQKWARERLLPFAGRAVRMDFGAFSLLVGIVDSGLLEVRSDAVSAPSVTIQAPSDWPALAFTDRTAIFARAKVSGAVDLAEAFGFVMRNLSWDIEGDVSGLVGDIAAHRVVNVTQRVVAWHRETVKRLAKNLSEYLVEEDHSIARTGDVIEFCQKVSDLDDQCGHLERRLQALTKR